MPVRIIGPQPPDHPITKLAYPMTCQRVRAGDLTLNIDCLADVEGAIDLVFHWLEGLGRSADEIERLAPYFGVVWPSALALAEYVSGHLGAPKLAGKKVLEIGCGLAVPSLVCATLGADVTVSDGHPDVLRFLERNVLQVGDPDITYITADWTSGTMDVGTFDFIIASDILYEAYHADFFCEVIRRHAGPHTNVVLTDPGRAYIQRFVNGMKLQGWSDLLQPWTVQHLGKAKDIFLLSFDR